MTIHIVRQQELIHWASAPCFFLARSICLAKEQQTCHRASLRLTFYSRPPDVGNLAGEKGPYLLGPDERNAGLVEDKTTRGIGEVVTPTNLYAKIRLAEFQIVMDMTCRKGVQQYSAQQQHHPRLHGIPAPKLTSLVTACV